MGDTCRVSPKPGSRIFHPLRLNPINCLSESSPAHERPSRVQSQAPWRTHSISTPYFVGKQNVTAGLSPKPWGDRLRSYPGPPSREISYGAHAHLLAGRLLTCLLKKCRPDNKSFAKSAPFPANTCGISCMKDESHNPAHIFTGVKFSLVSAVLIVGGAVQAATGLLGDSTYMRIVYPLLAAIVAIPFGLFAYAMFNQPKLRQKELDAKAAQDPADASAPD